MIIKINNKAYIILIILIIFILSACGESDSAYYSESIQSSNKDISINYPLCSSVMAGKTTTCRITRAYCSYQSEIKGSPTFCNDAKYPNHNFTLLIWGSNWSSMDGKCLIISGIVENYKGKTEIVLNNSSQVKVCD